MQALRDDSDGCSVYSDIASATTRLVELDLTVESLRTAIQVGIGQASACTENDPPMARGLIGWMKAVRGLREELMPNGWARDDSQNYSTVIHPTRSFAIAVAGGDAYTGMPDKLPSTRSEKGPVTRQAIERNIQGHFSDIYPDFGPPPTRIQVRDTWLLLYYEDDKKDETRIELSLPRHMTAEGFVTGWLERIIIAPLPGTAQIAIEAPNATPDDGIDIEVTRRTG